MGKYKDEDTIIKALHNHHFITEVNGADWFDQIMNQVVEEIKNVPTADVAPRWIPVTDKLPEEKGTYLVTVVDGTIKRAIAQWWYDFDNGEGYFVCDDCYAEDIVAWMPLPSPYKEGEQNG